MPSLDDIKHAADLGKQVINVVKTAKEGVDGQAARGGEGVEKSGMQMSGGRRGGAEGAFGGAGSDAAVPGQKDAARGRTRAQVQKPERGRRDDKAHGKVRAAVDSRTSMFSFSDDAATVSAPGQGEVPDSRITGRSAFGFRKTHAQAVQEDTNESMFATQAAPADFGPQYGYDRKLFGRKDEVSAYTAQMDARYAMDPRKKMLIVLTVSVLILFCLSIILPIGWLTEDGIKRGFAGFVDLLGSNIDAFGRWIAGDRIGNGISVIFWQTAALVIVGAALAVNGAVYQGTLKNALASPSTLGVMSGGTLGTVIYTLVYNVPAVEEPDVVVQSAADLIAENTYETTFDYIMATQLRAFCSLAGCIIVVALVLLIAYIAGRGKVSKVALVIAGQVFASIITGVVSIVRYWITYNGSEEQIEAIRGIAGGSMNNILTSVEFLLVAIPLAIGLFVVMRLRFRLNTLAFNDEEARSMGMSVAKTRNAVIIVCTVMTAVITSFCGAVGFVGFLIPHITRKLVGPDFRYFIPCSALMGSVYLLISNYVMKVGDLFQSSLGTFTSLIGVIFFLVAVIVQRRRGNVDWI